MPGPCLCGDPYCGSCGNPEEAAFHDAMDVMIDKACSKINSTYEIRIFYLAGLAAVRAHRKAVDEILKAQLQRADEEIGYLKMKIDELEAKGRERDEIWG